MSFCLDTFINDFLSFDLLSFPNFFLPLTNNPKLGHLYQNMMLCDAIPCSKVPTRLPPNSSYPYFLWVTEQSSHMSLAVIPKKSVMHPHSPPWHQYYAYPTLWNLIVNVILKLYTFLHSHSEKTFFRNDFLDRDLVMHRISNFDHKLVTVSTP